MELLRTPVIPETITVHLGPASSNAQNVTVPFSDYIKNVASSEIYPTWPESTLRANILAQISFALNRIYTEYYRSRGYDFDITNSTALDQSFVQGRQVFENISQIVNDIFDDYIRRQGNVEPLFAQYCNGTTTTCDGLSQWGSAELGEQGNTSVDILRTYYGNEIEIVVDAPIEGITESAPEIPLRLGSVGDNVRTLQLRLNRVGTNYPNIPKIYPEDGIFENTTQQAVEKFQQTFNLARDGVVGKSTWYELERVWAGVKKLNELTSEGISYDEVSLQFPDIQEGDTGVAISIIQYFLDFVSKYIDSVTPPEITGVYDAATIASVESFQSAYGIPVSGEMTEETWNNIYDSYIGIIDSLPESAFVGNARPYPGLPLRLGARGEEVTDLQNYLNTVSRIYTDIPTVDADGIYGAGTQTAVETFQRIFGLPVSGIADLDTWNELARQYDETEAGLYRNEGQYPGYEVGANGQTD